MYINKDTNEVYLIIGGCDVDPLLPDGTEKLRLIDC